MKKHFPMMLDSPSSGALVCSIPYWILGFFIFPALLSLSTILSQGQPYEIWLEIGYHLLNFVLVLFFFFTYLRDSFIILQVHTKEVLKTAGFCAMIATFCKLAGWNLAADSGNFLYADAAAGSFLTTESDLFFFPTAVLYYQPLWGTLCLGLLAPITVSCLLYASVFAPICTSRPWLAYPVMAGAILLIRLSFAFCLWPMEQQMAIYWVQLPVHMLACWSYQKTDTVWAPILMHLFTNLVLAPFVLILIHLT